jgi:hypothetical protein
MTGQSVTYLKKVVALLGTKMPMEQLLKLIETKPNEVYRMTLDKPGI